MNLPASAVRMMPLLRTEMLIMNGNAVRKILFAEMFVAVADRLVPRKKQISVVRMMLLSLTEMQIMYGSVA